LSRRCLYCYQFHHIVLPGDFLHFVRHIGLLIAVYTHEAEKMTKATSGISALRTMGTFLNSRACSDTLFSVLVRAFDHPLKPEGWKPKERKPEERAATPFAGGIFLCGYQCGMLWGSTLAAGAQAHRLLGPGPQAETEAIFAAQRIVESFRVCNKHINCSELTVPNLKSSMQVFKYFFLKGGSIGCFRMASRYAPIAFSEIHSSLSDKPNEAPSSPVSCSAVLARKIGMSDLHTVMVAGFAGGIGLSGGGCGALGAAVWVLAMNSLQKGGDENLWKSKDFKSRFDDTMEKFLKSAGHEIECCEIVGRTFKDVGDHACYLRVGGCSKIIETLAAQVSTG
jgi:hypothetical protein